jgi:hypothetical protein
MAARAILLALLALTAPALLPVGGSEGRFRAPRPDRSTTFLIPVGRVDQTRAGEADLVASDGDLALLTLPVPTFAPSGIVHHHIIDGRIRTVDRGGNNVASGIRVNILPTAPDAVMIPDPWRAGCTPSRPNRAVVDASRNAIETPQGRRG